MSERPGTVELFRQMLRIRLVEERIADLYPEQEMRCPVHLSIGQEAAAVGACAALRGDDTALSSHRAHGHYLAKGGDLKSMLAEIYGRETGCARGRGGSMHLRDTSVGFLGSTPIVAGTVPIGVGVAFGARMSGSDRVTAVFFGEGTTEEGVVHEAMNFAVLHALPVVFVCENNLYSVYTPLHERQPDRPLWKWAEGYGMAACHGDGNDVEEVLALTTGAVERARGGGGPTFLELATYRWREHCGVSFDNDLGYRTPAEFEEWQRRCPLEALQARLLQDGALTAGRLEDMRSSIAGEIDEAVAFAKDSPFPPASGLMEGVYAG